jgi:hypothetical protein
MDVVGGPQPTEPPLVPVEPTDAAIEQGLEQRSNDFVA